MTLKPYMFVKTVVVFAEDVDDAFCKLPETLKDLGEDIRFDWAVDELSSDDAQFENDDEE